MAFDSSTVSIGQPTRKSDYDRLMDNTVYLYGLSWTLARGALHLVSIADYTVTSPLTAPLSIFNCNTTSPRSVNIQTGANDVGNRVMIWNRSTNTVTVTVTRSGSTVLLYKGGSLFLGWTGTAWQYIGSTAIRWLKNTGTAQPWRSPWEGMFRVTVIGGGGGGGGASYSSAATYGGGGGGGGGAQRVYPMQANASCTYSVGAAGTAGAAAGGNGGGGGTSSFTDGTVAIQATGGSGGAGATDAAAASAGERGSGSGTGADILPAEPGLPQDYTASKTAAAGRGGNSPRGIGGAGRVTSGEGNPGGSYGGGGGGGCRTSAGTAAGGAGAGGMVLIEVP